jgi:hypothetical protein
MASWKLLVMNLSERYCFWSHLIAKMFASTEKTDSLTRRFKCTPLGSDRFCNHYWLFEGSTADGVEKDLLLVERIPESHLRKLRKDHEEKSVIVLDDEEEPKEVTQKPGSEAHSEGSSDSQWFLCTTEVQVGRKRDITTDARSYSK